MQGIYKAKPFYPYQAQFTLLAMDLDTQKSSKTLSEEVSAHVESYPTRMDVQCMSSIQSEGSSLSKTDSSNSESCKTSELSEMKWRENTIEEKRRMRRKRK